MEYLPSTLKVLHLGVAGLGLYVSIEGQDKLDTFTANASGVESTARYDHTGFQKDTFMFSAYIVTIVALVQLAVLFYFHNYGAKESHFRVAYFTLAIINIIFSSILLQGAATLLVIPEGASGTGAGQVEKVEGKEEDVAVAAAVLGALVIAFNFVNMYHAAYAMGGNDGLRITPRRK